MSDFASVNLGIRPFEGKPFFRQGAAASLRPLASRVTLHFVGDRPNSAHLVTAARLFLILILAFATAVSAQAPKKKPLVFAVLIQDTPVELAEGAKWMMDKGDAFPVVMFKEQQTKVVLQLAGTTFMVDSKAARILDEKEVTEELLAAYRRNVASYLDGKAKKWLDAVSGGSAE